MSRLEATFDTTFFVLHYFSDDLKVLSRTKELLRRSRRLGSKGILPTIVLAEFYVQALKRAGRDVAELRFKEMLNSGLAILGLDEKVSYQSARLRSLYQEKVPWGDCIIAATAIISGCKLVVSEDDHFSIIKEVDWRRLEEVRF